MKQDLKSMIREVAELQNLKPTSRLLIKLIREKESPFKFYKWEVAQNYAYITYLSNFMHLFSNQSHAERKRVKVFTHLSKIIKTRTAHQVKSHHQKMIQRHKNAENIVEFLRTNITQHLFQNPALIPQIQRINQEAEMLFKQEREADTMAQQMLRHVQAKKKLKQLGTKVVKAEEGDGCLATASQLKTQCEGNPSELKCLQQETSEPIVKMLQ